MEPLEQLKDIHLPEAIPQYPLAIGWWILATIVVLLCIWGVIAYKRYRAVRKHKKLALKQLVHASDNQEAIAILKWAALQYFPRKEIANLFGDAFQQFLLNKVPLKSQQKFTQLCFDNEQLILASIYQSEQHQPSVESTRALALFWLDNALPPKTSGQKADKANDNTVVATSGVGHD